VKVPPISTPISKLRALAVAFMAPRYHDSSQARVVT
jgi:hypothetical protein